MKRHRTPRGGVWAGPGPNPTPPPLDGSGLCFRFSALTRPLPVGAPETVLRAARGPTPPAVGPVSSKERVASDTRKEGADVCSPRVPPAPGVDRAAEVN